MKDGVCVRRRPEASLKSLICRCVPSLPKRLPGQEVAAPAACGPPTRPQVRENCSQRLSRDARSMPNSLPFGPAITRTYASPAAQPHRCCSLSRHRRLPGCLCVQAHRAGQTPAAPVRTPGTGRPRLQPLPAIADPGRPGAGLLQRRQPDRRRGNPPDPAGDLADTGGEPAPPSIPAGRPHHPAGGTHPHGTVEPINEQPGILAHILLSILAYGLLTIAVFQALLLLLRITASSTSIRPG